jgi:hypothetical protein
MQQYPPHRQLAAATGPNPLLETEQQTKALKLAESELHLYDR